MKNALNDLNTLLQATPYVGYAYAYPHKTAYRPLDNPIPLQTLWAKENRDALFLYLHVPFCEMRCGFCNLFTTANPKEDLTVLYLQALQRQAKQVREAVGEATFARFAIGGGTPTFLDMASLETLFDLAHNTFGITSSRIPVSVETSPRTAETEKLTLLRERGVDRISIGIQSFVESEAATAGRAQKNCWVEAALERIRSIGFQTLNIDLIYGLPGQTVESWISSLQTALRYTPEELFLYPLYVRPLTGLGRRNRKQDDIRLACYRAGRDFLLANGYTQVSMRMFTKRSADSGFGKPDVAFCCQEDGMVGIGCGSRSYTREMHYSNEYAVGATGVRTILHDYVRQPDAAFAVAAYGFALDAEEQRRRYLIQSLLQVSGMDLAAYHSHFGTDVLADFPQLSELEEAGLANRDRCALTLTEEGIAYSDMIGPWLYSPAVHSRMDAYELH